MTQFATLSTEAQNIVRNFYNAVRSKEAFSEPKKILMVSLYETCGNSNEKVLQILKDFRYDLSNYLQEGDLLRLRAEYANVVRYCSLQVERLQNGMFNQGYGQTYLPDSLVELCSSVANVEHGKSVYLPYCGDGSFVRLCQNCEISGFEQLDVSWALSQVVLSTITDKSDVVQDNRASNVQDDQKFDYIFTFPPFVQGREGRTIVDTIYSLITEHFNDNGEFFAILPMSFCYASSGWFDVRKILLERKEFSSMVITLPSMLEPFSNVSLCMVHFVKDYKGLVLLADASTNEFFAKHDIAGLKENVLKVQSVIETIQSQDEQHVWVGSVHDLTGDLDLSPARYLISQNLPQAPMGFKYHKLKDLIGLLPLTRGQQNGNEVPLVGMKELSFSFINCEIKANELSGKSSQQARLLSEDALLVGFIGGKFKVGRMTGLSEDSCVSLRPEVFAVRVSSDIVTEDYLLYSILSAMAEQQAKALATGVTITRLKTDDFLDIAIAIPSIEEQERICKAETRKSLSESDRMRLESYDEFRQDMHMKKHAIGQTIFNLNNWWKVLQKARKEGEGVVCDSAMIGKSNPICVSSIYDNLQEAISQLQQQISKFDRGNGLEVTNFALTAFIENYIAKNQSPLFRFIYDSTRHRASQNLPDLCFNEETGECYDTGKMILNEGDPIEYADFAPDALKIVFDNIISNACAHGFVNSEGNNLVKIELYSEGNDFVVTISNNGEPIHGQLSEKDVFTYGKTSKNGHNHYGIGGYEVKKLMREFDGDALFVIDSESDFPVSYKLIFHSTNIKFVL